jgi:type IV pilus assembly protein PilO
MNYDMLRDILRARKRLLAFVVFLALLNLALALYLSLWQRPELARAQGEWFAKREAIKSGESVGTAAGYQNGVRDLAAFEKRLIPKKDFARFLSELYDICKANSLTMKGISYKPTVIKGEDVVSYGISFTLSGRYASVKSFIADFQRLREMVTLDALSLSNASNVEENVDLRVQITAFLKLEGA